jgi:uncharacterized membrane protein
MLYQWFTRYTIYTGLPDVLGWEWHQEQQRGHIADGEIPQRLDEINQFYLTTNGNDAYSFLKRYDVRYFVVGQLEEANYPGPGLDKFTSLSGVLWDPVYHDQNTTIYAVRVSP